LLAHLKERASRLKAETYALYLAARHPGTPWYAKLLVAGIVAYALSPIDLIPDFVPVLGYLDELVLIPLGIALAIRIIPSSILEECTARSQTLRSGKSVSAHRRHRHCCHLDCARSARRRVGLFLLEPLLKQWGFEPTSFRRGRMPALGREHDRL
jgi:uncharacterized membrane protein YkvA (DUF1232 family)